MTLTKAQQRKERFHSQSVAAPKPNQTRKKREVYQQKLNKGLIKLRPSTNNQEQQINQNQSVISPKVESSGSIEGHQDKAASRPQVTVTECSFNGVPLYKKLEVSAPKPVIRAVISQQDLSIVSVDSCNHNSIGYYHHKGIRHQVKQRSTK